MSNQWERRRILIWGKTRPEVSAKYRETVCTGGMFADTGRLVRLYPIPLRYMNDEKLFQKYHWIEADVARASDRDRRPESYRINPDGIVVREKIGTSDGTWATRAHHVLRPSNTFASVEALQAQQAIDHTSLGVVKPKKIVQIVHEPYSKPEREAYWRKYRETVAQLPIEFDEDAEIVKPLTPPDFRFQVRFTCDGPACRLVHKFSVLDWEVDAMYFRQKAEKGQTGAANEVVKHLESRLRDNPADVRFFLGNISTHPHQFTIVGLWYPTKVPAATLFDELALQV
jgi:hypothetical protein